MTVITTHYSWEQIPATAVRTGKCPTCGKRTRRTATFVQSLNPLNKIPDPEAEGGKRPKTRAEVQEAVRAEADAWQPDPDVFEHEKCRIARLAPPVVDVPPAPRSARDADRAQRLREAAAIVENIADQQQQPPLVFGGLDIEWRGSGPTRIDVGGLRAGEFLLWVQRLDADTIAIERGGSSVYVHLRVVRGDIEWRARCYLRAPDYRDPFDGADAAWGTDRRGRRSAHGTVTAAGFRTMMRNCGEPEILPGLIS